MELRFPCASHLSHLPSILPFVAAASFWLVVALIIIDRRPFNAAVFYILYFFVDQFAAPNDGMVTPMRSLPSGLCSTTPPTGSADYRVDCWLSSSIGGHLRPRSRLPLYFLMRLALALQSTEPAMARAHRTTCACFRTIGSGGAKR